MFKKAIGMCVLHLHVLVHVAYIVTNTNTNVGRYITTVWL